MSSPVPPCGGHKGWRRGQELGFHIQLQHTALERATGQPRAGARLVLEGMAGCCVRVQMEVTGAAWLYVVSPGVRGTGNSVTTLRFSRTWLLCLPLLPSGSPERPGPTHGNKAGEGSAWGSATSVTSKAGFMLVPWEAETLLLTPQARASATHAFLEAFLHPLFLQGPCCHDVVPGRTGCHGQARRYPVEGQMCTQTHPKERGRDLELGPQEKGHRARGTPEDQILRWREGRE